jgi:hypothetical protein
MAGEDGSKEEELMPLIVPAILGSVLKITYEHEQGTEHACSGVGRI